MYILSKKSRQVKLVSVFMGEGYLFGEVHRFIGELEILNVFFQMGTTARHME